MIGSIISHYEIVEKIGEGGMGVVYKAEDTKLKRPVALKFLPPDLTRDLEANARFIFEAQSASALDHQNVCTIYEIDKNADSLTFISMAYYEGQTLRAKIAQGELKVAEGIDIAIQIAQGLIKAHGKGIVHRDIKPTNIIVQEDGTVKIIDFGLSKLLGGQEITRSGSTLGTIAYLSPEQAMGKTVDHRTDIWSLGIVLYEMLTGVRPFKGEIDQAVIYAILNLEPKPITQFQKDIPAPLSQVVDRTLQKNPDERYQDMRQVLEDLQKIDKSFKAPGEFPLTLRVRKKVQKSRFTRIAVSVIGILLLVLAAFFFKSKFFEAARNPPPKTVAIVSFENQTGDESFDYLQKAIPNLLITSLEQSDALHVATWERMYDILKQMRYEDVDLIDRKLGFELCRQEGIETIILGSFTKAGEVFVTDAKILDVATKELIKGTSSSGTGVASILNSQIDAISEEIVRGLGLSQGQAEKIQYKIVDVTTSSIEAYENYLRGLDLLVKKYDSEATPFLQQAVEIDTTFAMAYHDLAYALGMNRKDGREAIEKAMKYANRATEKERLFIEATYARRVEYDTEKWRGILNRLAQNYPNEKEVHYWLGRYYNYKGMYETSIDEYNRALALDPYHVSSLWRLGYEYCFVRDYENALIYFERYAELLPDASDPIDCIAETYFRMGKLDEAIAKYKLSFITESDAGHPLVWYCYALKEDYTEAMRWIDKLIFLDSPAKDVGYYWKAFYHAWLGDLERALDIFHIIEDNEGSQLWLNRLKGWFYYDRGEWNLSRKYVERAYKYRTEGRQTDAAMNTAFYCFQMGLVDLAQGHVDSAEFRLAELMKLLPEIEDGIDRNSLEYRAHFLNAEIWLARGKMEQAISIINRTPSQLIPIPDFARPLRYNLPFLRDQLARAYYQKGELDNAIAEYERLTIFDPNSNDRYLVHPKYYYRLGKLYEEKGLKDEASARYERFLDLWKDADEDLPELSDAKMQLAKLNSD